MSLNVTESPIQVSFSSYIPLHAWIYWTCSQLYITISKKYLHWVSGPVFFHRLKHPFFHLKIPGFTIFYGEKSMGFCPPPVNAGRQRPGKVLPILHGLRHGRIDRRNGQAPSDSPKRFADRWEGEKYIEIATAIDITLYCICVCIYIYTMYYVLWSSMIYVNNTMYIYICVCVSVCVPQLSIYICYIYNYA